MQKAHLNPAVMLSMRKHIRDYIVKTVGINCLTTKPSNLLMWAHYASAHTGFCVRFNREKLANHFLELWKTRRTLITPHPVEYHRKFPAYNHFTANDFEKLRITLLIKSKEWKYEDEYRLMFHGGANKTYQLADGIIDQVIMGCEISNANEQLVTNAMRARNDRIQLLKARKNDDGFGVHFETINY